MLLLKQLQIAFACASQDGISLFSVAWICVTTISVGSIFEPLLASPLGKGGSMRYGFWSTSLCFSCLPTQPFRLSVTVAPSILLQSGMGRNWPQYLGSLSRRDFMACCLILRSSSAFFLPSALASSFTSLRSFSACCICLESASLSCCACRRPCASADGPVTPCSMMGMIWYRTSLVLQPLISVAPAESIRVPPSFSFSSCVRIFRTSFWSEMLLFAERNMSTRAMKSSLTLLRLKPVPPQRNWWASTVMSTTVVVSYSALSMPRMMQRISYADCACMMSSFFELMMPYARSTRYARPFGSAWGSVDCANRMSQKRKTVAVGMKVAKSRVKAP
mmetsp:Transcript_12071/g.35854  ORF Transcript_12071/g.35854 Transcript_12071/m.35854 type:complete len:333 (+) Transcript_12071:4073-5071(+)